MNCYETKYFDVETELDFDHVTENHAKPRVTFKKKLADNLWLEVFVMVQYSAENSIMCSLSLNGRNVVKAVKDYGEDAVKTIDFSSDEMKELVHVNDEPRYFCIEDYVDSILSGLRNSI